MILYFVMFWLLIAVVLIKKNRKARRQTDVLFGPRLVGIIAHAQCGKLPDVNFSARKNTPRIMKYLNYLKIMHSNDFFSFKFDEYKLFAMLAKQNYSKIHLVTLKIEQEISFPHYARCYFVWGIVFLGCLINISMTYIKKNGKKCLFRIYSHLWNHFSQCGMSTSSSFLFR